MRIPKGSSLVIPFPTQYETLNTRFCKRREWVDRYEKYLNDYRVYYIFDEKYRDDVFKMTLSEARRGSRPISLVDNIIRAVLSDDTVDIDALVTFNVEDFEDICRERRIYLVSGSQMI